MNKLLRVIANTYIAVGLILITLPFLYIAYTEINTQASSSNNDANKETEIIQQKIESSHNQLTDNTTKRLNIPVAIKSDTQYIKIPAIGLDTQIYEGDISSLDKGVWRMNDHGLPYEDKTMVLAAHRWGAKNLTNEYRAKNLFYNLPAIRPGDEIEITWDNIKYLYRVLKIEESNQVTDLTDLILITCKYVGSPVRIFVYAQLINYI